MAVGILTSFPAGPHFDEAVDRLMDIANMPVGPPLPDGSLELPQVHALNCLKDSFSNSRLADKTESFVERALELAVRCLTNDTCVPRLFQINHLTSLDGQFGIAASCYSERY